MDVPRRQFVWALPALCLAIFASAAQATQVRPVNLEEMATFAASIFSGEVLEVRESVDPVIGHPVTSVTFRVDRVVKGAVGSTLSVRMLGGDPGNEAGLPRFRAGDELVLFLYGESELGLSSPVGLGQGRFTIATDKSGRRIAINDLANRNLLRGLTAPARERLGSSFTEWKERRDVGPDELLDMAASLGGQP